MNMPIDAVDMTAFAYARGEPPQTQAVMRSRPDDFKVVEQCTVEPEGEGEHLWLWVEKTGLTTPHVAECLARMLEAKPRDIGYSGLKDRWAVTRQWFSAPWPIRLGATLPFEVGAEHKVSDSGSFRILSAQRHTRKLRRGTHKANAFVITLRNVTGASQAVETDLNRIAQQGMPNYFGPQRFGHGGKNIKLAHDLFSGQQLRRKQRGFALSAARAFLFNSVLGTRIRDGTWNQILPGEAIMLAGSHSVFNAADESDDALEQRLALFDIHPSGPLAGQATRQPVSDEALLAEQQVLEQHNPLVEGLCQAQVDAARRALRVAMRDLTWHWPADDMLTVEMTLPPGSYATSLLREFCNVVEPTP